MLGATIEINNVKKHTYNDWNLKWVKVEISSPVPRKNYIDVPGMDGKLDLSESLTGEINYENRKIKLIFEVEGNYEKWSTISSEIMNFLHCRQAKIIIDTDKCFYYVGRFELTSTKEDYLYGELILSGDVEPYKYEVTSSLEDWLWNDFNFENGIIREYKDLQVVNKLKVNSDSDLFALERDNGVEAIIFDIYQTFDGKDLYSSIEEKAANFLYLIIKNHVFIDGNKRIAATLFIYFLEFYNLLYKDGKQVIDNNTLVAITLLIAQSNPKEKEILVDLVMNFLSR